MNSDKFMLKRILIKHVAKWGVWESWSNPIKLKEKNKVSKYRPVKMIIKIDVNHKNHIIRNYP